MKDAIIATAIITAPLWIFAIAGLVCDAIDRQEEGSRQRHPSNR